MRSVFGLWLWLHVPQLLFFSFVVCFDRVVTDRRQLKILFWREKTDKAWRGWKAVLSCFLFTSICKSHPTIIICFNIEQNFFKNVWYTFCHDVTDCSPSILADQKSLVVLRSVWKWVRVNEPGVAWSKRISNIFCCCSCKWELSELAHQNLFCTLRGK